MTREEAIKIIDCYDIGFYDLSGEKIPADKLADAFDMAIEALSAEAVQGWIPCSDRLPEKTDMYLVTYGNTHGGKVEPMAYPLHYWQKRWMSFDHSWESKTVTAWMPLPKPYKGGDDK